MIIPLVCKLKDKRTLKQAVQELLEDTLKRSFSFTNSESYWNTDIKSIQTLAKYKI
jgi:hypothetical protein